MMKKICALLCFLFCVGLLTAQVEQDCGAVDCPGRCGRFIDLNGDGFCDRGRLSSQMNTVTEEVMPVAAEEHSPAPAHHVTATKPDHPAAASPATKNEEAAVAENEASEPLEPIIEDDFSPSAPVDLPKEKKPYDLIWISVVTLGLYALTSVLVKMGRMKLATHRKIWNFILLITFLVSCLFGFFLVIQINYHIAWNALATIRYYHVQFGIAMTIVAVLHVLWHIPYFKTYFKKKRGE